jgi:putative ABC transport system substrate-binding protein
MNRRDAVMTVVALCASALTIPPKAFAQQQRADIPRIGWLDGGSSSRTEPWRAAFRESLYGMGYVVGRNVVIEHPREDGQLDRMPAVLAELIRSKVDVIVVWGTVGAVVANKATQSVPVVFLSVGAPVEIGLVKSLARPGGNMTGVTFEAASETYGKRLQLLKEIAPRLSRVAVLQAAGDANVAFAMTSLERAAPSLGIRLDPVEVRSADELESAFGVMNKNGAQALVVIAGSFTFRNGKRIADLARAHRLPSIHSFKETVEDGGLISLGPDFIEMARRGAALVDVILKGTKPSDIPVEQPTRYELHINLKTAKAIGITIPQSILLRADRVIE